MSKRWTPQEIQLLTNLYNTNPDINAIQQKLPHRNTKSIDAKLRREGLITGETNYWTPEEDQTLTELYTSKTPMSEIKKIIHRSEGSIYNRVNYLKITKRRNNSWTYEELVELSRLKHTTNLSNTEIAEILGRSKTAVQYQFSKSGLIYNPIHEKECMEAK